MVAAERIEGSKSDELIDWLQQARTLLSMRAGASGEDRLVYINAVEKRAGKRFLLFDPPPGFAAAVTAAKQWRIRFTFTGPDGVECRFHTEGGGFHGRTVRVPFPGVIERQQRRRDFRMDTDPGTCLFFDLRGSQQKLDLINVSLSGALGALDRPRRSGGGKPVLKVGSALRDGSLHLPPDDTGRVAAIPVKKAVVRRMVQEDPHGAVRYGIEFVQLEREARKRLARLVYDLQRRYLQHR